MASSTADQIQTYSLPSSGGGFSDGSSGGFVNGGSSGGFINGGSSGGFVDDGSSGGFINGGSSGGFSSGGGSFSSGGGSFSSGGGFSSGGSFGSSDLGGFSSSGCGEGEIRKADGTCARAQITRNIFLYAAPPAQQVKVGPAPPLPDPKVHYNFVFVRTPSTVGGARPVVVPPPQQKTLVYVLSKRPDAQNQEIIEVPSTPTQPEVFFVNYAPGDNPELPGGIDLQQALSQSVQQGQFIEGSSGSGIDLRGGSSGSGDFVSGGSSDGFVSGGGASGFVSGGGAGGFVSGGSSGGFISGGDSGDFGSSGIISGGGAPSTQYSSPN